MRPFFVVEAPGIKPLPQSPPFRIQITMVNTGQHVASDLEGRILFLKTDLSSQPEFDFQFSVANAIPPKSPTPWYNDSLLLPLNVPPQYVVLSIKYFDQFLGKTYRQIFLMKWEGVNNGVMHPDFVYTTKDQGTQLTRYLKEAFGEFAQEYSL